MRNLAAVLLIALACGAVGEARAGTQVAAGGPDGSMLPARTLRCTLGRALNLDPSKFQKIADIKYEGAHQFTLFLPGGPKRRGPPPDPTDPPEPVDPKTRIMEDPAGLASDMKPKFARVIDLWPERIEMVGTIDPSISRLIIISDINPAKGIANLFMTRAKDAASLDLDRVYQGGCRIELQSATAAVTQRKGRPAARQASRR